MLSNYIYTIFEEILICPEYFSPKHVNTALFTWHVCSKNVLSLVLVLLHVHQEICWNWCCFYILVVIFSQTFCFLLMADLKNVLYMNLYIV